jgi:hypothetical protein
MFGLVTLCVSASNARLKHFTCQVGSHQVRLLNMLTLQMSGHINLNARSEHFEYQVRSLHKSDQVTLNVGLDQFMSGQNK